jgi:hypothetical protein
MFIKFHFLLAASFSAYFLFISSIIAYYAGFFAPVAPGLPFGAA